LYGDHVLVGAGGVALAAALADAFGTGSPVGHV
jgi:hypothetical protein